MSSNWQAIIHDEFLARGEYVDQPCDWIGPNGEHCTSHLGHPLAKRGAMGHWPNKPVPCKKKEVGVDNYGIIEAH
jgi:hypothetical protein